MFVLDERMIDKLLLINVNFDKFVKMRKHMQKVK